MQPFALLTDSSADLPQNIIDELAVTVLPLRFTLEGKTYSNYPDGREMSFSDFYAALRAGSMVQTSAVNVEQFLQVMRPLLAAGQDVLYLGFSSALSSTYSAGFMAAQELREEFPERKILTVDTLAASQGQGMLVYLAAKKRAAGEGIDAVAAFVEETKLHLCHWFTVDDLFFLKRGGRVSAATAVLGSALGIKPVMHVDDQGRLINVSKTRGRKNSIHALFERMRDTAIAPENQTVFIVHGDCVEEANDLAQLVRQELGVRDVIVNYVGPVIGAHSGPNTMALFFLGQNR